MTNTSNLHEQDKDTLGELFLTGRYQSIPRHPRKEFQRTTLAAGAVLWRGDLSNPASIEVACIHRPHYDDWSLAKGKVDPGEALITTAVREIKEETGYDVRLGKLIGKTIYPVKRNTKVVYYWTGQVIGGKFVANEEVDEIRWLPIPQAQELMTYELDRKVLEKAQKRFALPADTRILYLRHARAGDRRKWQGNDALRPVDKKGTRQAEALAPQLAAFGPTRIYSAEPDRCVQTVTPAAKHMGLEIEIDERLGENMWRSNRVAAQRAFAEIIAQQGTSVVCSQGGVMPEMIAWLSAQGRLPIDDEIHAKKAGLWVLSFNSGELIGADYLPSPLPVL